MLVAAVVENLVKKVVVLTFAPLSIGEMRRRRCCSELCEALPQQVHGLNTGVAGAYSREKD